MGRRRRRRRKWSFGKDYHITTITMYGQILLTANGGLGSTGTDGSFFDRSFMWFCKHFC